MRKNFLSLALCISLLICGCSLRQNSTFSGTIESSSAELIAPSTTEQSAIKIELFEAMDVTNIEYIEPYDENTVYLIGAKRDKSLPSRELVYALCTLDTGEVSVLHREIIPIDWAYNMAVYRTENENIKLFTGQQILSIDDKKVVHVERPVKEQHYEAFVDLETNQMVYTEGEPPSLFYSAVGSDDNILIFEAERVEIDGNEASLFPYCPRLNRTGDKILYGTALDDTSQYQTVAIRSIDGKLISETEKLDIKADFLDMLWYNDGFITLELTDSYETSPTGLATIFTKYDEMSKEISESVLYGMALSCQRKFYANTPMYAFAYKTDKANGIALWDTSSNQAYYVQDVDGHVLIPTVTPSGSKILWSNHGYLFASALSSDDYEKIPVAS